jgi:hypothetical protein
VKISIIRSKSERQRQAARPQGDAQCTDAVPHSFRSAFNDWGAKLGDYPQELLALASLAHAVTVEVLCCSGCSATVLTIRNLLRSFALTNFTDFDRL